MREFKEAYSILRGSVSGHINRFLNQAALNGIVYTRGKIAGGLTDGFDEVGEPSDDPTMIPDGTLKKIQGIAMARGILRPMWRNSMSRNSICRRVREPIDQQTEPLATKGREWD